MATQHMLIQDPWRHNNILEAKKTHISESEKNKKLVLERLALVASKELREDQHIKQQCLEQLREWIGKNEDIQNCFLDDNFLLRFLRVKKFSIPMAQQTLLKYLNFRKRFSHIMYRMDYLDSSVNEIIDNGYMFASPFRDSNGRRVIIYNLKNFNPHKYNSTDMARVHAITYETLVQDEENQIMGINHVGDVEGAGAAFVTMWSISEFATIVRWGEQSFPMRHKEMNILNMPAGIKYVFDFVQANIRSPKLKQRFLIHESLKSLQKQVDKRCLPLEMGGVMPTKDMVQLWREELAAKRDLLLSYDRMNLLSDKGIIRSRNAPAQDDTGTGSLPGSFRKLEVD